LAGALAAERGAQVAAAQSTLLTPAEAMAAQAAQAAQARDGYGDGSGDGSGNGAGAGRQRQRGAKAQVSRPNAPDPDAARPVVKDRTEKVGRNEPCWCGSGKKFKFCHGAA
jgi:preprotein translocase subunit SecA